MIQSKKLLMNNNVTLTVTTNPASATCTLTYNGQSYSAKSAIVPKGTVISYSIYHSTYGTTTGSITMTSNKTLNCDGTYSTSTIKTLNTNYNNVGGVTVNSSTGAASGFSGTKYISLPKIDSKYNGKTVKVLTKATFTSTTTSYPRVIMSSLNTNANTPSSGWELQQVAANTNLSWIVGNGSSYRNATVDISSKLGTTYYIEATWGYTASNGMEVKISSNKSSWTSGTNSIGTCSYATNSSYAELTIGARTNAYSANYFYFPGTIYLMDTEIYIGGSEWWKGYTYTTSYNYYWNKTIS